MARSKERPQTWLDPYNSTRSIKLVDGSLGATDPRPLGAHSDKVFVPHFLPERCQVTSGFFETEFLPSGSVGKLRLDSLFTGIYELFRTICFVALVPCLLDYMYNNVYLNCVSIALITRNMRLCLNMCRGV